jgi:hypothetical protein
MHMIGDESLRSLPSYSLILSTSRFAPNSVINHSDSTSEFLKLSSPLLYVFFTVPIFSFYFYLVHSPSGLGLLTSNLKVLKCALSCISPMHPTCSFLSFDQSRLLQFLNSLSQSVKTVVDCSEKLYDLLKIGY